MKKFIFTGILMASMLLAFGQPTVLITETFEDYSVGDKLVQKAQSMGRMYWTAWNKYDVKEDATIVSEQASEGTQSAKFAVDNDVVLLLGNQTSGSYTLDFKMYIPSGKTGYFNVLHKPPVNGAGQEWAMEIYFNANGTITLHADLQNINAGNYTQATWLAISMDFDLDEDYAILKLNGTELRGWKFSLKPGGEQGTKQLGGLDLYGGSSAPGQQVFDYYIDDIVYTQTSDPKPLPTVTVDGDLLKKLLPKEAGNVSATLKSEDPETQDATWSMYVEYPVLDEGTQTDIDLTICDEWSVETTLTYLYPYNFTIEMATRLTPNDYKNFIGGEIKDIAYYVGIAPNVPIGDITFRVYGQGDNAFDEGEILAEKVLPLAQMKQYDWNGITLDEGVKLTGGEYWVAVSFLCPPGIEGVGPYPLSMDAGPSSWGGDWDRANGGPWKRVGSYGNYAIKVNGSGKVRDAFVTVDKAFGTTLPGASTPLTFAFNAGNYPNGEYEAKLIVMSNDADNPVIEKSIVMIVDDEVESTNTNVEEVTVDDVVIPAATSGSYDYRVEITIPETKITIDIAVTPEHPKANVTGQIGEQPVNATQVGAQNLYTFTVTAEDGTEKDYTLMVFAKLGATAISELNNAVQLYPNPVTEHLYMKSDVTIDRVVIYDLTGKVVKQVEQPGISVDLKDLSSGFYLLRVTTAQGEAMQKFIKE
ncbi:MAG: T9SS type A sorting domain-containing protein [Bacteroidales bacterium]|nr:T9SS type A sorting domain-containing protein [Bacteroidales bacterium]